MDGKHIQFGNEGEELVPGKTENLSSSLHEASRAAEVDAHLGAQTDDEEKPDQFDRRESELATDRPAPRDSEESDNPGDGERDTGATGG